MIKKFYSNGKLLITGEYLVLDGAKSLALPTKYGQSLEVETTTDSSKIFWQSLDLDRNCWFEAQFDFSEIINFEFDFKSDSIQQTLLRILKESYILNPLFLKDKTIGYTVTTKLNFPRNWGLGTSSTLINNVASWLQIDAFELLYKSFGGSGYDIACAQNDSAITYQLINQKPVVGKVNFDVKFKDYIYFLYLNQKQSSKSAIKNYRSKQLKLASSTEEISEITDNLLQENITLKGFQDKLVLHEKILSSILEIPTVKDFLFSDFDGVIKSLGAWGGDFVMVISDSNPKNYFSSKGFEILLTYDEMILSK